MMLSISSKLNSLTVQFYNTNNNIIIINSYTYTKEVHWGVPQQLADNVALYMTTLTIMETTSGTIPLPFEVGSVLFYAQN